MAAAAASSHLLPVPAFQRPSLLTLQNPQTSFSTQQPWFPYPSCAPCLNRERRDSPSAFVCSKDAASAENRTSPAQRKNSFADSVLGFFLGRKEKFLIHKSQSQYNYIRVFEFFENSTHEMAGGRTLLLDKKANTHSVYWPNDNGRNIVTNSYYDFVSFLPLISDSDGPLCILGLAGGTAARILLHYYPHLEIHGWEIDPQVVQVARQFFDLSDLEILSKNSIHKLEQGLDINVSFPSPLDPNACEKSQRNTSNGPVTPGGLVVHIGDALQIDDFVWPHSFSSIFVDLYSKGIVIPPLQQPQVWARMKKLLKPGGKILVNCGGGCVEADTALGQDGEVAMRKTLEAMHDIFPERVFCKRLETSNGNVMALLGDFPDMEKLRNQLPHCPSHFFIDWFSFQNFMKKE